MSILGNHRADYMIKFVIPRGNTVSDVIFVPRFQYCLTKTKHAKFKLILTFCDIL